jgi:hypothetical protein
MLRVSSKKEIYSFFGIISNRDVVSGICYNPLTRTIWASSNSSTPVIIDPLSGTILPQFPEHRADVDCIQNLHYIPFTNEIIAVTGHNRGIVCWKYNPFTPESIVNGGGQVIETLTFCMTIFPFFYDTHSRQVKEIGSMKYSLRVGMGS